MPSGARVRARRADLRAALAWERAESVRRHRTAAGSVVGFEDVPDLFLECSELRGSVAADTGGWACEFETVAAWQAGQLGLDHEGAGGQPLQAAFLSGVVVQAQGEFRNLGICFPVGVLAVGGMPVTGRSGRARGAAQGAANGDRCAGALLSCGLRTAGSGDAVSGCHGPGGAVSAGGRARPGGCA